MLELEAPVVGFILQPDRARQKALHPICFNEESVALYNVLRRVLGAFE